MNRIFTLLAIGLFSISGLKAQMEIGVIGFPQQTGITNGDKDLDPYIKNRVTFSAGGGLTFNYHINDNLSFYTGALYSAHNQKFTAYATVFDTTYEIYRGKKRLDYLKVPLALRINKSLSNKLSMNVYAGPQISYLLKGDGAIVVYEHFQDDYTYYFDLPPASSTYYKKVLFEVLVGGGIDYHINRQLSLNTGIRLDFGLNDTENKSNFDKNFYSQKQIENTQSRVNNFSTGIVFGVSYVLGGGASNLITPHSNKFRKMPSNKKFK